jgi:hypothetical protein
MLLAAFGLVLYMFSAAHLTLEGILVTREANPRMEKHISLILKAPNVPVHRTIAFVG